MSLHLSIVADVFTYEAQAIHAVEALRQAGFAYDQIGIAICRTWGFPMSKRAITRNKSRLGIRWCRSDQMVVSRKRTRSCVGAEPSLMLKEWHLKHPASTNREQ